MLTTFSEEPVDENVETCVKYLKRMAPMKQWLEMEIGITVGVSKKRHGWT
jgi:fructose-bisphosphate aldolase class II